MKKYVETLILGIISGILSGYIIQKLPDLQTTNDVIQYINHPLIRFILGILIIYYLLREGLRRYRNRKRTGPITLIGKAGPPRDIKYPISEGTATRFDVNWEWEYGSRTIGGDNFVAIDGPYCPECGAKLLNDKNKRRLRKNIPIWKCSSCPFDIKRPNRYLYEEEKAVAHFVENEMKGPDRFDDLNHPS